MNFTPVYLRLKNIGMSVPGITSFRHNYQPSMDKIDFFFGCGEKILVRHAATTLEKKGLHR